ncbi:MULTISPECIES: AAA family ATPase [Calothrix]|uniref:AAA family ATPase n=2 Tax=Calothrix TaxID=1186 RepID=A0ABR8A7Q8_9CYAN|nr:MULTISPECIES: AAA family ATPase [Calothrix]MBD2195308.1 AAA family ATPase [Calothrix parietina FACHB-288]MBD2223907.1 AAA family ATPase [Calothrix anomala FACHB-343]
MNSPPKPPTTINSRGHPPEFEQIIQAKSHNFIGREFVFTAIDEFIKRYRRGYFTITGAPGSGKSAILAKYATDNPHVVYYNVEVEGKNRAEEFINNICTQLIEIFAIDNLPVETFQLTSLHQLIQKISDELAPEQKLIITIDGLDRIDRSNQSPGTNLFYLPRYLPDKVYFLLTRRPFLKEKSGLLIETPFQTLNLAEYPAENQQDIQRYIQQFTLRLRSGLNHEYIQAWLNHQHINEQELCNILATKSANNFMYISQVLTAMAEGFDAESFDLNQLPTGLETYYQQHWQQMKAANQDEELSQAVLNILVKQQQPLSVAAIAELINADEFDIEEVLESWFEFLIQEDIAGEEYYSFYHHSFREWLANKV